MGYFDEYHIFRDPIHGYIKAYDIERDIINSLAFQRLRRIKQLGPTNLVYHGADHTRFAHSIGVMELSDRVLSLVLQKDRSRDRILSWSREEALRNRAMLRLVALLHDIGHGPFSHSSESGLFLSDLNHENMSAFIILKEPHISGILNGNVKREFGFGSREIANFLLGIEPVPILQQIIMGPLDVDKMDYLWRDSYYTGVYYGRFDIDRLIHTLTIVYDFSRKEPEPSLGIEEGGVYVAEAMTLARYYMFLQVYFHEIRRAYDFHLTNYLRTILPRGRFPLVLKKFLKYDDVYVYAQLSESYYKKSSKNHKLAKVIYERNHYKSIKQTSVRPTTKEKQVFETRVRELMNNGMYKSLDLRIDKAEDAPNKFSKEPFYVKRREASAKKRNRQNYAEIDELSQMIKMLEPIEMLRLYANAGEDVENIKRNIDKLNWKP